MNNNLKNIYVNHPSTKDEFIDIVISGNIRDFDRKEKMINIKNLNKIWSLGIEIDFIESSFERFIEILETKAN